MQLTWLIGPQVVAASVHQRVVGRVGLGSPATQLMRAVSPLGIAKGRMTKLSEFLVYAGGELVGQSKLEYGDPPMGVAFGWMSVTPNYAKIAKAVGLRSAEFFGEDAEKTTQPPDGVAAEIPPVQIQSPDGDFLDAVSIVILDYSTEEGRFQPEVQVLGIPSDTYRRLFAHHWKSYEERFRPNEPSS